MSETSVGGRVHHALHGDLVDRLLGPFGRLLLKPDIYKHLWCVPSLPRFVRDRYKPGGRWWGDDTFAVPATLQDVPGERRDPAAEAEAEATAPLHDWLTTHPEAVGFIFQHGWRTFLPTGPRVLRENRRLKAQNLRPPAAAKAAPGDPAAFARAVKDKGRELGLSAVGVAEHNPQYTFTAFRDRQLGDRVIVCALDQGWAATNTAPSRTSEKAAFVAYAELTQKARELAEWLKQQGWQARVHDFQGENVILHYAVATGLAQMGINGQGLTPSAGSRCRITAITTDAPLTLDEPRDLGIHRICDECRICVRRCPSGAIPGRRQPYRGIEKSKLNMARCAPVVAQTHGCAVCMKVCPIQRYGLQAVLDEWERSGTILGKDTDELEGYTFHGEWYPAGVRPRLADDFLMPPGLVFDPTRTAPLPGAKRQFR